MPKRRTIENVDVPEEAVREAIETLATGPMGVSEPGVPFAASPAPYEALAAPFDHVFHDTRGGVDIEYATGEQVVTRLNETLGYMGWSFEVPEWGINEGADEVWARGRLQVVNGYQSVVREQFGSQKIKRGRASGSPLDIGFDLKGAATDALKKCASLIGVGLYLSRKEETPSPKERETSGSARSTAGSGTASASRTSAPPSPTTSASGTGTRNGAGTAGAATRSSNAPSTSDGDPRASTPTGDYYRLGGQVIRCAEEGCGQPILAIYPPGPGQPDPRTPEKGGDVVTGEAYVKRSQDRLGGIYCWERHAPERLKALRAA